MKTTAWRQQLGDLVKTMFGSPEMEHFYALQITLERARLYLQQQCIYVRHRRSYWLQVAANSPEMEVKRLILSHEHEELVEDEYSPVGHLDLIVRQAREVGLTQDELMNAEPLPTTRSACYAWWWIARTSSWPNGLVASSIAEWTNDERLLKDLGGAHCTRLLRLWERDLGFKPEQMPNFVTHSQADEKHSDMFLDLLERYVAANEEEAVIQTAQESLDLHRAYYGGLAMALSRLSGNGARSNAPAVTRKEK